MHHLPLTPLPHNGPSDIHVWQVDIPFDAPLESVISSNLSTEEQAQARVFRRKEDALRFATVRMVLRQLLASALSIEPHAIHFTRDAMGRPHLAPSTVAASSYPDFNVSHSGAHGLIALSTQRRVGVDIERYDPQLDWRSLAELTLSDAETQWFEQLSNEACLRHFYDAWVAKEALLKTTGVGVVRGLQRLTVLPREGSDVVLRDPLPDEAQGLSAHWLAAPAGYAACVAWSEPQS